MYEFPVPETVVTPMDKPHEYHCYCDLSGTPELYGAKCRKCTRYNYCQKHIYRENPIASFITKISHRIMRNKIIYHIVWSVLGPYDIKNHRKEGKICDKNSKG